MSVPVAIVRRLSKLSNERYLQVLNLVEYNCQDVDDVGADDELEQVVDCSGFMLSASPIPSLTE